MTRARRSPQAVPNAADLLAIPGGAARLKVLPGYEIQFDSAPFLVLVFGTLLNTAPDRFTHPNLLGKRCVVHEVKHYHQNGSKSWTRHPGANLYLALSKTSVKVVREHGYSYPKVVIAGRLLDLNVSGGGGEVWQDFARSRVSTAINHTVATLRAVADVALTVEQARACGIRLDLPAPDERDQALFCNALARPLTLPALCPGRRIRLAPGFMADGLSELVVLDTAHDRGQFVICTPPDSSHRYKVTYRQIDWAATGSLNGLEAPQAAPAFNHLPLGPGERRPASDSPFDFGDVILLNHPEPVSPAPEL